MSFRKEKKFRLTKCDLKILKFSLLNKGMQKLYPTRLVNSCYFDTTNLKMFQDSEEGIFPRKKLRFRWYDNSKIINKEIKISSIEGKFKKIEKVDNLSLNNLLDLKIYDELYGILSAVLIIRYEREYFIYKKLRLTFDTNINYEGLKHNLNTIDVENVMEIKSSSNTPDDYLNEMFDMQNSSFSKYSRGILSLPN